MRLGNYDLDDFPPRPTTAESESSIRKNVEQDRAASAITNWTVVWALTLAKSTSKAGNSGSSKVSSQRVGEFAGMIGHDRRKIDPNSRLHSTVGERAKPSRPLGQTDA